MASEDNTVHHHVSKDMVIPEMDVLIVYNKTKMNLHTIPNLKALLQLFLNWKIAVCKNNRNCLILTI